MPRSISFKCATLPFIALFFLNFLGNSAVALQNPKVKIEKVLKKETVSLALQNIALKVDQRIANMKILANTIANDAHIHRWIEAGQSDNLEHVLLAKLGYLVNEYTLTSASFADTSSNKYWNHEGFLRVLDPKIDLWYFNYLDSKQQDLISVYHDKNKKRVDLYVNYRQLDGIGLSGIATSFDGVVNMLNSSILKAKGEVFIVDSAGTIQIHPDPAIAGKSSLQSLIGDTLASQLLIKQVFNETNVQNKQGVYLASAFIPSMNWFVVFQMKTKL